MNVTNLFTKAPSPRPEPNRSEPSRLDRTRYDRPVRTESASSNDEPSRAEDENNAPVKRKPTRAEFSALLQLLAGAGTNVRSELLKQVPAGDASLIDRLLSGEAVESTEIPDSNGVLPGATVSDVLTDALQTSRVATDAMRYGLLKDNGTSDMHNRNDLAKQMAKELMQVDAKSLMGDADQSTPEELRGLTRALQNVGDHGHAREVLGRIVSRRGSSVDQLKALGQNGDADVRVALDALLSRAGTPAGLEIAGAVDNAGIAAAAAALASANATSAADVTTPVRTTDALAPELRRKLERVVERMKGEYGHDVSVVETARSQERQDFLFEQGRTRPGAVVTWTRDSAHTRGEAVDVIIDGTYNNAEGFARLQRIAREEGLRTLGVRDPGHLELASESKIGAALGALAGGNEDAPKATPLIATSAPASGVARVAGAAGVAGVARVAEPGASRGFDRSLNATTSNISNGSMSTVASTSTPASSNGQGNAFGRSERDEQGRPMNDGRKLGSARRETLGATDAAAFGAPQPTTVSNVDSTTQAAAPSAGVSSAERVADLQALRDNTPAGSVSRLTLNVDAPDGGQDRITVDLRGASVGTQISTDASNAERLRMRTAELQDALGRHGLESDSVRISSQSRAESVDATRHVVGERDGIRLNAAQQSNAGDGAMNQGQRERSANAREWDRPETSRQARDEQRESARQGAGQRGQRGTSNGSAS